MCTYYIVAAFFLGFGLGCISVALLWRHRETKTRAALAEPLEALRKLTE